MSISTIVGVDPGKTGALTFIDPNTYKFYVHDMPITQLGERRWEVNGKELANIVFDRVPVYGAIEDVWSLPNDGHVGAFSFGEAFGVVKGCLSAFDVKYQRVRPQVWKANLKAPKEKALSIQRCLELVPASKTVLTKASHDGRAESIMIALYGAFHWGFELTKPLVLGGINEFPF